MLDGIYQSVMVFFIPYLMISNGRPITLNGLDMMERFRLGAYIAHPAVLVINGYILMNTYRWDWIMLLVVAISDLFVFFWTGVYTSFSTAGTFEGTAKEIYGEASFWACFFIVPVMCLFPRFVIKALQKVYFPYDIDIIREQELAGKFDHLKTPLLDQQVAGSNETKSSNSKSSDDTRKNKHVAYGSVDEDLRPIYPPSTATRTTNYNAHSQNGSDSTNYTGHRMSLEVPMPARPSVDRARPSYDRIRASMDRMRPSFEASNDITSAARLSRIESSQSGHGPLGRFPRRLRGLSLTKSAPTGT